MRTLRKTMTVAALVVALVLAAVGSAFAAETEEAELTDLDTLKARVVERIEAKIEVFENRLDQLAGRDGHMVEQLQALFTEGITLAEQLRADVEEATAAAEIAGLIRDARHEFAADARVRLGYAHVQNDLAKFTHRVELLEQAITRAEEAGLDTAQAVAEASAARADLATAASVLAGVDPGTTAGEVVAQIRAAHRAAHSAQAHIRAGFRSLAGEIL
jgi:hypothetical protein